MSELDDSVLLAAVYLRKDGPGAAERAYVAALMEQIEREFDSHKLVVTGRCRGGDRGRVSATDYEIDWFGHATDTGDYCSVGAFRRGLANWTSRPHAKTLGDTYEDLAISKKDWDRINASVAASLGKGRPSDEEVDAWMRDGIKRHQKYELAIKACCAETGATVRQAKDRWKKLDSPLRRHRGERDGITLKRTFK